MTTTQGIIVGAIIGALLLLAVLVEPPAFMHRLFDRLVQATDAAFGRIAVYRHTGEHRPADGRVTLDQIRARLLRESVMWLTIPPDVQGFSTEIRRGIERVEVVAIGGGGAGRGLVDPHAGIAG